MSIKNYVMAGYPLLWVETYEEFRALAEYCSEMTKAKQPYTMFTWDVADGIKQITLQNGQLASGKAITKKDEDDNEAPTNGVLDGLTWLEHEAGENTILFLKDYHHYLKEDKFEAAPKVMRKIRNLIPKFKACGKVMIVLAPSVTIPDDIKKEVTVERFSLPDREGLRSVLKSICEASGAPYPKDDEPIIDASLGMTSFEAENAYSVSLIEKKCFDAGVIQKAKAAIVRKDKLLEVVESTVNLDGIGGLENLKQYLMDEGKNFSEEARDFGAEPPKGMLLVGVPGCGKSLTAKAVATAWGRPLLRLDVGKIFDKYQGESEDKMRKVLAMAEAIAPCVLWIDELEKSFSGTQGGDSDGHGTTKRVFQDFLTWLNEKTSDVFIVATANNVKSLPEELIRPGRIDAIFWVEAPSAKQRREIIQIHLKKKNRVADIFSDKDMEKLVNISKGMSGAGIEVWVKNSIKRAFAQDHDEVTFQDFIDTEGSVARITDSKNIKESRNYAVKDMHAMLASADAPEDDTPAAAPAGGRKLNGVQSEPQTDTESKGPKPYAGNA